MFSTFECNRYSKTRYLKNLNYEISKICEGEKEREK